MSALAILLLASCHGVRLSRSTVAAGSEEDFIAKEIGLSWSHYNQVKFPDIHPKVTSSELQGSKVAFAGFTLFFTRATWSDPRQGLWGIHWSKADYHEQLPAIGRAIAELFRARFDELEGIEVLQIGRASCRERVS
jgi:hypothetical protein